MCARGSVFVDELEVPGIGYVDLAGIGPDGEITLVECKLESNPEIHRKITGQIYAYAAGLWKMSYEEFDRLVSARLETSSLADAVRKALAQPEPEEKSWHEGSFKEKVTESLRLGRFTLVIAVDQITEELRLVVPYINKHTVDDVRFLALELSYVSDDGIEIVLPSVYGEESASEKRSHRKSWSPEAYFERLAKYGAPVRDAVMALVNFSKERKGELAGGTGLDPSLNVRFHYQSGIRTVWSSYYQSAGPTFDLNFEYLRDAVSYEAMAEAAQIMRSIDGAVPRYVRLDGDFRARPSLPVNGFLTSPGAIDTAEKALCALLSAAAEH